MAPWWPGARARILSQLVSPFRASQESPTHAWHDTGRTRHSAEPLSTRVGRQLPVVTLLAFSQLLVSDILMTSHLVQAGLVSTIGSRACVGSSMVP